MRRTCYRLPGRPSLLLALLAVLILVYPGNLTAQNTITWQQTGGPSGGKVNALAVDPTDPTTVYAGTTNGVYVSRDGGDTWLAASNGLPVEREVQALVVNPLSPDILYAGTTRDGVYRSLDGGTSWAKAGTGLTRALILSLAIVATRPDTLYAGTTDQVFKTTDGGRQWVSVSMGLADTIVWSLAVDPVDPDVVYTGTDDGVYKSANGGLLWSAVNAGLPSGTRVQVVTIDPKTPDVLYVGTDTGIYRSDDGAQSWTAVDHDLAGHFIRAVAVDPAAPDTVYAAVSRRGLYKSTDGGQNWTLMGDEFADKLILTLTVDPFTPTTLLAGTGRGVFRSGDGGRSWVAVNQGLTNTVVRLLAVAPQRRDTIYAGTEWGVFRSTDAGDTWVAINRGLANTNVLALAVAPGRPDTLYAGIWSSQIYRSDDGGAYWHRLARSLGQDVQITALLVTPASGEVGELYAGTSGGGVLHSTDGGFTWTVLGRDLPNTQVQTLAIAPLDGQPVLYAGTSEGLFRLELSSGDVQWQPPEGGLPGGEVRSIVVDHRHPSILYAALAGGGMFRSEDAGRHWATVSDGSLPTNLKVQALTINPRKTEIVYAGTDGGVFKSLDRGRQWLVVNDGLPAMADVQVLAADPQRPTVLYAGTNGNGVYRGTDRWPNPLAQNAVWGVVGLVVLASLTVVVVNWRHLRASRSPQTTLESNWPVWEARIEQALMAQGRVEAEMVPIIPLAIRTHALRRYVEDHPRYDLVFHPEPAVIELAPPRNRGFKTFLRNWKAAWEMVDSEVTFQSIASMVADQLCAVLGFTRLDSRSYKALHGYVVEAPAIRLRVPPRFPIIFLQRQAYHSSDVDDLRDFMGVLGMTSYFALLVDLNDDAGRMEPGSSLRRLVSDVIHDFIVLDGRDLRRILMARDPERELIESILGQVDLTVVSPYVISGPVPENMFFGRDNELKTITRRVKDSSFALVGGRKIGKTSILAKVYRLLTDAPDHYPLYLDCQTVADYDAFFEAVGTVWDTHFDSHSVDVFRRVIADLARERSGETVVVLLDEVDALLKHDTLHEETLFRVFRALSQEGYCRFVFCGERVLNARLHDPGSPLFNFCDVIQLSYLHPQAAHRIILEPMQEMGIAFESEVEMVERIVSLSSCHPNIVQYLCQKLIVEINARQARVVALKDLDVVTRSSQFHEYFLEVTWGNTTPLERIITLTMIDQGGVTLTRLDELLQQQAISVSPLTLEQAVDGLRLYSIIAKEGQTHAFANAAFPRIVRESQDVDALLDGLKQSLGRN